MDDLKDFGFLDVKYYEIRLVLVFMNVVYMLGYFNFIRLFYRKSERCNICNKGSMSEMNVI